MIFYETTCRFCRQTIKLLEGTKKYAEYKVLPTKKMACDDCERKIEEDSRKYLFDRE